MKLKKIYIEITNKCNLNCSFCPEDNREKKFISLKDFEQILINIGDITDYIYLHVKGEPLFHPELEGILKLSRKYNKQVNITTNGTILKSKLNTILKNKDIIRQINISLHSFKDNNLNDNYLVQVKESCEQLLEKTNIYISYRFWNISEKDNNIATYKKLIKLHNFDIEADKLINVESLKLTENLYLNKDSVFVWPSLENEYYSAVGTCFGLRTHVAILSNGVVVPCCLDQNGIIDLGNALEETLEDILKKKKTIEIKEGFQNIF